MSSSNDIYQTPLNSRYASKLTLPTFAVDRWTMIRGGRQNAITDHA